MRSFCIWHRRCIPDGSTLYASEKERLMNLELWIPITVALGLVTMGLMFAFVVGCDKV